MVGVEQLEPRVLMALNPSPAEQAMLEDLNRMRVDPQGELDVFFAQTQPLLARDADVQNALSFFRVDGATLLSQWGKLEPVAPLAWNESLYETARAHDQAMIEHDEQAHVVEGEPGIGQRVRDAGYDWTVVVENVFAFGKSTSQSHASFAIDWGDTPSGIQEPAGHRRNIMNSQVQEVGVAIALDNDSSNAVGPLVITQDFGNRRGYLPQLLGVVYDDRNSDGNYDAGEGLGGVNIEVVGPRETFRTTTMGAGGYQLPVPSGSYTVFASGGRLARPLAATGVVMAGENVKVDINTKTALHPPTALSDTARTTEDVPVVIDVLANDSDVDGSLSRATVQVTTYPGRGMVEIIPSTGKIRYRPTGNFSGTDRFQYRVQDNDGAPSNETTVTVVVTDVNDPPVAGNDRFATDEDVSMGVPILQNDSDVDGSLDPASVRIVRPPAHGDLVVDRISAMLTYVPRPNFAGTDSFSYSVQDNDAASSNVATATVTVRDVNDAPVVVADRAATRPETPVRIDVLANDTDVDGTVARRTVGLIRFPNHGHARMDRETGAIIYTPDDGFFGLDHFAYAALDNDGAVSNGAEVSVVVTEPGYPWRNPVNPFDIDGDAVVGPLDALLIIHDLVQNFPRRLLAPDGRDGVVGPFLDSNRDGVVSALDALLVIQQLTTPQAPGRNEQASDAAFSRTADVDPSQECQYNLPPALC